jgi:hypothetical protein
MGHNVVLLWTMCIYSEWYKALNDVKYFSLLGFISASTQIHLTKTTFNF